MQYLYIYKIKNLELWEGWLEELKCREKEILQTLKNENIFTEAIFLDKKNALTYYLIESDNIKNSIEIFNNSTSNIDLEHKKIVNECLEFIDCKKAFTHFRINK